MVTFCFSRRGRQEVSFWVDVVLTVGRWCTFVLFTLDAMSQSVVDCSQFPNLTSYSWKPSPTDQLHKANLLAALRKLLVLSMLRTLESDVRLCVIRHIRWENGLLGWSKKFRVQGWFESQKTRMLWYPESFEMTRWELKRILDGRTAMNKLCYPMKVSHCGPEKIRLMYDVVNLFQWSVRHLE